MFRNQHVIALSARQNRSNFSRPDLFHSEDLCTVHRNIDVASKKSPLDSAVNNPFANQLDAQEAWLCRLVSQRFLFRFLCPVAPLEVLFQTNRACARASSLPRVPRMIFLVIARM